MPERDGADCPTPMDEALRERLVEVVRIHGVALERLLFDQTAIDPTVADLLRDIGETYLEFSEALYRNYRGSSRSGRP